MARLNPFARAVQAIQRIAQNAQSAIRNAAETAANAIKSLGGTLVSPFANVSPEEDEIFQRREEELRRIEEEQQRKLERIAEVRDFEEDTVNNEDYDALTSNEKLWLSFGITIEEGNQAEEANIYPLDRDAVNNLKWGQRVRRKAHPTVQSAINYMSDIPEGYRIGVAKIGSFYYGVVFDPTKSESQSRGKKRKSSKRGRR